MMKDQRIRPDELTRFYLDQDGNQFPVFEVELTTEGLLFRCRKCAKDHPTNAVVGLQYGSVTSSFKLECPHCGAKASFTGALAVMRGQDRWEDRVKLIEKRAAFAAAVMRGDVDGSL